MVVVPVDLEPSFRPGTPELLFDGEHFAMLTIPQVDLKDITVVVNWARELKRRD